MMNRATGYWREANVTQVLRLPWQRRYQALAKANAGVNSANRFGLLGELLLAQERPCMGQ
jgi:hypothetical protein